MKNIIVLIIILYFISCNKQTPEKIWENAITNRVNNKYKEAIIDLESIINKFPENKLASKAEFELAEIFLNDIKDYDIAIDHFNNVILKYENTNYAKNSLFMIGYIYNNYLENYSRAIKYYKEFLNKYPSDELTPSVNYEINELHTIQKEIDSLNSLIY